MNTELVRITKAAKSVLRVDPCDISSREYRNLRSSASDLAEDLYSFIEGEDDLDEDTICDLSLLLSDLQEVARG